MSQIRNQNIVITGAARGIGRLVAQRLATKGGKIVAWDIDQTRLDAVVAELKAAGAIAEGYRVDLSQKEEIDEVARRTSESFGPIDIVVNNAGVVTGKRLLELSDHEIERTIKINTLAPVWVTRAFLPTMLQRQHGHIVTIASSAGMVGISKLVDYCTSKWGALGFAESLRAELKETAPALKTTVVCPYFIDTGMFDGAQTRFPRLLPILKESFVADQVVQAIVKDRARVHLPALVNFLPAARLLPTAALDGVMSFLGVNVSMDHFHGR